MNGVFVAARAVHFGATMLLFGELAFASFVAAGPWRRAVAAAPDRRGGLDRHVRTFAACSLAVSALSGVAWLLIEATAMSGTTLGQVLAGGTLGVVLQQTEFGHVFVLRAALFAMLAASLAWLWRATAPAASRWPTGVMLALAAVYLAMLAGAGHAAAASDGVVRFVHVGADAFHLLAAGGWLGALPALVFCFGCAPSRAALARLARRFSVLGIACVGILIASGVVNTLYLVGSFAALFGTRYGDVLVVKLALFALLLAIAAINRSRLTPRLADEDPTARRSLRRNAMLEIAGGVLIVALVGALGTMVPGAHQSPVWPFAFALDFSATLAGREVAALVATAAVALAAIALIISGVRRKAFRMWVPGCVVLLASVAASTSIFAVPAFPTTYATSPVPYTVDAVARGATRYARECSSCHGTDARGDGPAAAGIARKPANLAGHGLHHAPGNLFWWIAHGIPGTSMPAFAPRLSEREIWELVQFVAARASAESALSLDAGANARSMSRAPDFTYELPPQGQRTLFGQRTPALLVLYTLPQSAQRLATLGTDHRLMHADVRVIGIPLPGSQAAADDAHGPPRTLVNADAASVYAMFARSADGAPLQHAELLVDGSGIVRARWIGLPGKEADRNAEIVAAAQRLPAPSRMPATMHHGH